MRRILLLSLVFMLALGMTVLTGCGGTKEQVMEVVTYEGEKEKVRISLSYPETDQYRWSTNQEDFGTTTDNAVLIGKDFKIAIQFTDISQRFNSEFEVFRASRTASYESLEEVSYGGINGFTYYYEQFSAYIVQLPIPHDPTQVLTLYVYTKAGDEEGTTAIFSRDEIQQILDTVKIEPLQNEPSAD